MRQSARILIVRRENIGDLVLTTPLIAALRQHMPGSFIGVLVNSYNAAAVARHPDIDKLYVYTKGKHADSLLGSLTARLAQLRLWISLRRAGFDDVILAEPAYSERNIRLAHWIRGGRRNGRIIGFRRDDGKSDGLDIICEQDQTGTSSIAELVFRIAHVYGIQGPPPPCRVVPRATAPVRTAEQPICIGLQISARNPTQRWPVERFAALAQALHAAVGAHFRLYWAPGAEDDARHPGDDRKAMALCRRLQGLPLALQPVQAGLGGVIDDMAQCDLMVTADGGAMHLAAGLGIPVVCFFGDSDPVRWRPWGVPYRVLRPASRNVADLDVAAVQAAVSDMLTECRKAAANVTNG